MSIREKLFCFDLRWSRKLRIAASRLEPSWLPGMWLGKTERPDEHLIATETPVVAARSVARRPEDERRDSEALVGLEPALCYVKLKQACALQTVRRGYIPRAMWARHGMTSGCPSCLELGPQHTEDCRERCTKIWAEEARLMSLPAHQMPVEPPGAQPAQPDEGGRAAAEPIVSGSSRDPPAAHSAPASAPAAVLPGVPEPMAVDGSEVQQGIKRQASGEPERDCAMESRCEAPARSWNSVGRCEIVGLSVLQGGPDTSAMWMMAQEAIDEVEYEQFGDYWDMSHKEKGLWPLPEIIVYNSRSGGSWTAPKCSWAESASSKTWSPTTCTTSWMRTSRGRRGAA